MKTISLIFSCICIMILSSCSDKSNDPCDNIICEFGSCNDGTCNCLDGYEGDNCDQEERAKFIGSWNGPFAACMLELFIMDDLPEVASMQATIVLDQSQNNALLIELPYPNIPLEFIGIVDGVDLSIAETEFQFEYEGFPQKGTVSGSGLWLSENRAELSLDIDIEFFGTNDCFIEISK